MSLYKLLHCCYSVWVLEVTLWLSGTIRLGGKLSLVSPLEKQGREGNRRHALFGSPSYIKPEKIQFGKSIKKAF